MLHLLGLPGWRESLEAATRGCWDSVSLTIGPQLSQSWHSLLDHLGGGTGISSAVGQEYQLGARRLRVLRQLGEGGYSFVYLVRDVAAADTGGGLLSSAEAPHLFALKRVLCGGGEQLREAEQEVAVMRRLRHPCLLPLLDASTQLQRTPEGGSRHVVLMLFPVYDGGNLHEFAQRLRQEAQQQQRELGGATSAQQARREAQRAHLRTLLHIFLQVCAALHAMHAQEPPLAHRDVKPLNVLLRSRQAARDDASREADGQQQQQQQQRQQQQRWQQVGSYDPVPPIDPLPSSSSKEANGGWNVSGWEDGSSSTAAAPATGAVGGEAAAVIAVQQEGEQQQQEQQQQPARHHRHASWDAGRGRLPKEWWQSRLPQWRQQHEAVLMDFGSARPTPVAVRNRSQAMAVQEDAERHCTAPFRAPELWDVPSSCTLDERVDVWSLGCLLYFLLCGQSPFERAAGEAGGSLMLAVVNGRVSWPDDVAPGCPESLKQLVMRCLETDPASRPGVDDVAEQADRILAQLWL